MNFFAASILSLLVVTSVQAHAEAPVVSVFVHEGICNEIREEAPKSPNLIWSEVSGGGSNTLAYAPFNELKKNQLSNVSFGKGCDSDFAATNCEPSSRLTLNFVGQNIALNSIQPDLHFGTSFNNLIEGRSRRTIGKVGILYENNRKTLFNVPNDPNGYKQKIVLAVIYINAKQPTNQSDVTCKYVSGDLDMDAVNSNGNCVWIDQNSKAFNGLPYCW